MIRSLLILTISFAIGFTLCLVVRAGLHHPYAVASMAMGPMAMAPAEHASAADGAAGAAVPVAAPTAGSPGATPAASPSASPPSVPPSSPPSAGAGVPARPASSAPEVGLPRLGVTTGTVNSICPVCGVEVDASLPTSMYHGHLIGFGCRPNRCKERFDADPERFGPAALANRKAE